MIVRTRNQSGFTLIEGLIILVVIAVIGALGYTFYSRMNSHHMDMKMDQMPQQSASTDQTAPEIKQTSDLDKATDALNQTDLSASDSSDVSQFTSATSGF